MFALVHTCTCTESLAYFPQTFTTLDSTEIIPFTYQTPFVQFLNYILVIRNVNMRKILREKKEVIYIYIFHSFEKGALSGPRFVDLYSSTPETSSYLNEVCMEKLYFTC